MRGSLTHPLVEEHNAADGEHSLDRLPRGGCDPAVRELALRADCIWLEPWASLRAKRSNPGERRAHLRLWIAASPSPVERRASFDALSPPREDESIDPQPALARGQPAGD